MTRANAWAWIFAGLAMWCVLAGNLIAALLFTGASLLEMRMAQR